MYYVVTEVREQRRLDKLPAAAGTCRTRAAYVDRVEEETASEAEATGVDATPWRQDRQDRTRQDIISVIVSKQIRFDLQRRRQARSAICRSSVSRSLAYRSLYRPLTCSSTASAAACTKTVRFNLLFLTRVSRACRGKESFS